MKTKLLQLFALCSIFLLLPCCVQMTSTGVVGTMKTRQESARQIHWPAEYEPSKATFFVHNEIEIEAPPEVVWDILVLAEKWPNWYEGASNVKAPDSRGRLQNGQTFRWSTMGLAFDSKVVEFEAPYRLAWESRRSFICGYHAWRIIPQGKGCKVVTDESQFGTLAVLQKIFIPKKLEKLHGIWLAEMKKRAESPAAKD